MRRIFALILMLSLMAGLCACGKGSTIEGKGYKTPEEALMAYAEALKTGDLDKILATYAVESHVEHFDMGEYIDRLGGYAAGGEYMLSSVDDLTRDMGILQRQYKIVQQLNYMYLYAAFEGEWDGTFILVGENREYKSGSKFLKELEPENWAEILKDMEIGDILEPEDLVDKDNWKSAKKSLANMEKYLGADDITALALEIELDGEDYYLCPTLVCYGEKWYVLNLMGVLANLMGASPVSGGLVEQ